MKSEKSAADCRQYCLLRESSGLDQFKHLVKDRMERTGMRWNIDGAQAMLELRTVEINEDWKSFWRYHISQQRQQLYGHPAEISVRDAA